MSIVGYDKEQKKAFLFPAFFDKTCMFPADFDREQQEKRGRILDKNVPSWYVVGYSISIMSYYTFTDKVCDNIHKKETEKGAKQPNDQK